MRTKERKRERHEERKRRKEEERIQKDSIYSFVFDRVDFEQRLLSLFLS
mgnify:CR=1 FL=1